VCGAYGNLLKISFDDEVLALMVLALLPGFNHHFSPNGVLMMKAVKIGILNEEMKR